MANAVLVQRVRAAVGNAVLVHKVSAAAAVGGNAVLVHKVKAGVASVVADAGPPQANLEPGVLVTLTAAASSSGGGAITSYVWVQTAGPTVTLTGSGATRTFSAPGSMDGTSATFQVTVTDVTSATASASVVVTVLNSTEFVRLSGAWVPTVLSTRAAGAWT